MTSKPQDIRQRKDSTAASEVGSVSQSRGRHASIARLGSPLAGTPSFQPRQPLSPAEFLQLPGRTSPSPALSASALSAALANSPQRQTHFSSTAIASPRQRESLLPDRSTRSNYGSLDVRHTIGSPTPSNAIEDPEIVRRHLVQSDSARVRFGSPIGPGGAAGFSSDEFSSLQLQGGDITREVYKWAESHDPDGSLRGRYKRSQSFRVNRPMPEGDTLDANSLRQPGGFRRDYLRRTVGSPDSNTQHGPDPETGKPAQLQQRLFTNSFFEFLTLYGHFAGEELEEDEDALEEEEDDDYFAGVHRPYTDDSTETPYGEDSSLLTPGTKKRRKRLRPPQGQNSAFNAALLLLKSFVGTGVLFLPRAFLNGGMLFSSLVLLLVACLSYYCFILLTNTRSVVEASFGDIGGILYGRWMRNLILFSIVLSQIGFVSAYIVFTSENLQAFVSAVTSCRVFIDIKYMVLLQLIVFLPLSLIRDIGKLGFTALIADAFILLGLLYLYYYDIFTIASVNHGLSDIRPFNPSSWTLFIGTAIFTFEGVGLIIPIQESMSSPQAFPKVLGIVMLIITVLMTSIGALSYSAFGSSTRTVILLNLPQQSHSVNTIQLLYSLAILLSTPLQLFPAVRILETGLFTRSGKNNPRTKWEKNMFRFICVVFCALIAWGGAGDLDKFVSLVGSFACIPLVYIYPPLLHLKAVSKTNWQKGADYALAIFGFVACVYTTGLTVQQWVGSGTAVEVPRGYCS